jgi:hypothetical protein
MKGKRGMSEKLELKMWSKQSHVFWSRDEIKETNKR